MAKTIFPMTGQKRDEKKDREIIERDLALSRTFTGERAPIKKREIIQRRVSTRKI